MKPDQGRFLMNHRPSILFIDDEVQLHRFIGRILEEEYVIHSAYTGLEGLEKARILKPNLILLDLMLPEMTGLEVLKKIKESHIQTPVIIVSGYGKIDSAVQTIKLGAVDYVEKPFQNQKIKDIVKKFLYVTPTDKDLSVRRYIIGESPQIKKIWDLIDAFGPTELPILLEGPTGTGKELFSRAIHEASNRRNNSFVAIDCSTLPESLIEGELFGFEKGAFTGANASKPGRIEWASGGTLFLDEITNIPLAQQAKLLRMIQEQKISPLGGKREKSLDIRFVCATNIDIREAIRKGTFREDLYYRLSGLVIKLPPLTERQGDIELLIRHFLEKYRLILKKDQLEISDEAMKHLLSHSWPGNIRELAHTMYAAVAIAERIILPEHFEQIQGFLPSSLPSSPIPTFSQDDEKVELSLSLACDFSKRIDLKKIKEKAASEIEKKIVKEIRKKHLFNQTQLAQYLGIDPKTLRSINREPEN